jgi:hypothetical protein
MQGAEEIITWGRIERKWCKGPIGMAAAMQGAEKTKRDTEGDLAAPGL